MVERLRMLEKNRHLREKIKMCKDRLSKMDMYYAEKMRKDERDLSDEEYMKKWGRNKG